MAKKDYGTRMYNGKLVPLTADGLINKVYVKKEDRELIDETRLKLNGMEKERRQRELQKFLDELSK